MRYPKLILALSLALSFALAMPGCFGTKKSDSNEDHGPGEAPIPKIKAAMSIGALNHSDSIAQFAVEDEAELQAHGGWAHVDGMKIKILKVNIHGGGGGVIVADYSSIGGKELEIGAEATSVPIETDVELPIGVYLGTAIDVKSEYDLKAYGYTSTETCYTTKQQVNCIPGKIAPGNLPGYDYFHYEFLYLTTSESPTSITDRTGTNVEFARPLEVISRTRSDADHDPGSSNVLRIQLRIDNYRLTTFWDGQGPRPRMSPFHWGNNYDYPGSAFLPDGVPNFGITYIPMYLSVNDPGETIGEVYVVSNDRDPVQSFDPESHNLSEIQYLTVLFKSSGELATSRIVNFDNGALLQFNTGSEQSADSTFRFYNGECCRSDGSTIRDRLVSGFYRTALEELQIGTLSNGPDCGSVILHPVHPGNRARECLESDIPLYFKRVR